MTTRPEEHTSGQRPRPPFGSRHFGAVSASWHRHGREIPASKVPAAELSAGYVYTHEDRGYPLGWYAAGAVTVKRWLALVGEVGYSRARVESPGNVRGALLSDTRRLYSTLAGPRFVTRHGRVGTFAQFLAGYAPRDIEQVMNNRTGAGTHTYKDGTAGWGIQPGGGVTVDVVSGLAVRAAYDVRFVLETEVDGGGQVHHRVLTGLVWQFGKR